MQFRPGSEHFGPTLCVVGRQPYHHSGEARKGPPQIVTNGRAADLPSQQRNPRSHDDADS